MSFLRRDAPDAIAYIAFSEKNIVNLKLNGKIMKRKAKIYYIALNDFWRKEEKLAWLRDNPIEKIEFERLEPDAKHNWINQIDNGFDTFISLASKDVKSNKNENAIVKLYGNSIKTNRDEWVYDFSKFTIKEKAKLFTKRYLAQLKSNSKNLDSSIKWSRDLENKLKVKIKVFYNEHL